MAVGALHACGVNVADGRAHSQPQNGFRIGLRGLILYIYFFILSTFSSLLALTKLSVAILTQASVCTDLVDSECAIHC